MKNFIIGLVVVIILAALGFGGWYFFLKKSPEGGACTFDSKCEAGLKCANKFCSSGKTGSSCAAKTDCTSGFCVTGKCTEGKQGETCTTYKDCQEGLLCTKGTCSPKPDYSQYFDKVMISKMKPGLPPGPNNPTTVTDTFSAATDAIEFDFVGVKPSTVGPFYVEFANPTTGVAIGDTKGMETKFDGHDTGMGTDFNQITPGQYDVNVFFQDQMIYSTKITVTK